MSKTTSPEASPAVRWAVIVAIAALALFASYRFAIARNSAPQTAAPAVAGASAPAPVGAVASSSGSGAACACCGGASAAPADPITGAAEVSGDVQTISVDLSKGYYDPNVITLKAGVPAEITFGQSSGCTAAVQSQDLGFYEDLTGGPKTVKIPALEAGTYTFTCGMNMVSGTIVVE